jgi:hypothetical protein
MPTETRVITFSNAEIGDAIVRYCVKTGRLPAKAGVTALIFSNEGGLSASFEPVPPGPRVTFQENEIAAAVLLHCKERGIPIARRSIKSLQLAKDAVMLTLTMPS